MKQQLNDFNDYKKRITDLFFEEVFFSARAIKTDKKISIMTAKETIDYTRNYFEHILYMDTQIRYYENAFKKLQDNYDFDLASFYLKNFTEIETKALIRLNNIDDETTARELNYNIGAFMEFMLDNYFLQLFTEELESEDRIIKTAFMFDTLHNKLNKELPVNNINNSKKAISKV